MVGIKGMKVEGTAVKCFFLCGSFEVPSLVQLNEEHLAISERKLN